ncbi:MAG TPA: hypothetical protein ENN61_02505, partial [Bacteroidaceae bacterium]|nr:hypothetical protein [Bacteroidaceae bacterium]
MKKYLPYLPVVLLLAGCSRPSADEADRISPLYPDPITAKLDTVEGYKINPFTGDSVEPIILSTGEVLRSGVALEVKGEYAGVPAYQPWVVPAGNPIVHKVYETEFPMPDNLAKVPVNEELLVKKHYDPEARATFINSTGDTIQTGTPVPLVGVTIPFVKSRPVKALLPRMRDNAIKNIQYLDVDQGLNSSVITCLLEDRRGNIWIGTNSGGISFYDGVCFNHITKSEGLSSNNVTAVFEDRHGNIWIGTDYGLNKFDGESFVRFTEKEGLTNNSVTSLTGDSQGNIWIGLYGGGVSRYDGELATYLTTNEGLSNNTVNSVFEDTNGNIWITTWGGGVNRFNGHSFLHITEKDGLCNNYPLSIIQDDHGNLWFGTTAGVNMYDGESLTFFSEKEGLSSSYVLSVSKDSQGDVWFCTQGRGVTRLSGKTFFHYTEKEGLSSDYTHRFLEDSYGN